MINPVQKANEGEKPTLLKPMINLIIFDFDGVILESVLVKTEAFRTLFSFAPDHVGAIVRFHSDNSGMSRFEKFNYIYKYILKKELTPHRFQDLSETFSTLVFDGVIKAPFVQGACEFIKKYHEKIPLYIVSATPHDELISIVAKKGIRTYFRNVYGSPRKKTDCIREILNNNSISPSEVIFVGDTRNDLEAAKSAQVRFIGRTVLEDPDRFSGYKGVEMVLMDLHELDRYVEENL